VYSFDGTNLRSWRPGADLQDAIAVDGSGKVWVGAKEGAMCFDGEAWKTYTKADGLADDSVRSIAVDRDGVLWFGTQSGISSYDGSVWRTWSVNSYTDPAYQCPRCLENPVPDIAVDRNNVKWFGTCYGLARFDGASWTTWTPEGGGLLDKKIVNIVVDAANRLWIAYDGFAVGGPRMITRFDGVEWRHFSMDGPSWNEVLRVGVDRGGVKWFYCGWSGMSVFDGASWRTVVPTGAPGDFRLFDFTVSADVVRWFATQKGLWRFDGEEWRAFTAENSGLASNYVSAVAVDGSGVLWCGTGSGVSSFDGALWKTYREPGSPGQEPVNCVLTDRVGAKWFGTDKGVFRFDGASWMSFGEEPLIGSVRVLSAAVDSRNVKWFATLAGLVRFDGERWTRFTKENSGLTADYAFKVVVDRADVLWIVPGYPKALVRYDGVSWDSWEFYELPFQGGVNDIAVDERNVKWFATTWGISSFDDGPSDGPTVVNEPSALPAAVRVLGNSPNPFNSSTVIRFALPRAVRAELAVFDVTGRKVRTLVSGQLPAGTSEARWDGRDDSGRAVSSGIYLSRLAVGGKAETRKMMLIR
jgi:ligand-binding sensor domain-containing protein